MKESEKQNLQKDFDWMKTHPKITMQVEGHCDLRGSDEYNLALGERRARAIKDYLMTMGIPSDRISIISYGREKPLSRNESEADQAMNRRANFVPLKN